MYEISKFSTVNIREYLAESKDAEIGEDVLLRIFSDFSCPINPDVEQFLKERAIEFTKKNQSVTYLVISRVSELDEASHSYNLSAYLIAQIGKNYTEGLNNRITGKELLELAIDQVKDLQYQAGGMVIFLEAENKKSLMKFYQDENNFKMFSTRKSKSTVNEPHTLVQLLKTL